MNKKGFTLVELLATVLIIAAIALLSFPILTNVVRKNKDIDEKTFKENAILAAKTYCNLSDNKDGCCSVSVDQLIKESYLDKTNNDLNYSALSIKCSNGVCKYKEPTAVDVLLSKTNDASVTTYEPGSEASHQMYTFNHPATEQTEALTDYRYIGSNPYNYVDFNCDDNGENCDVWRIVGIFTVKNGNKEEQRIKLVRALRLKDEMAWDYNEENEWPSATLNAYLNGEYYQSLTINTRNMIEPAVTYLGAVDTEYNFETYSAEKLYLKERGILRYDESRSLNDIKNVTLLYPSDYLYIYANNVDRDGYYHGRTQHRFRNWIYDNFSVWTVSPGSYSRNRVVNISYYDKGISVVGSYLNAEYVRPVVYLKSSVQFDGDHTGSSDDHYVLKLDQLMDDC